MDTRKRILVVEDIAVFRESCIAHLERADYHVDGAESLMAARSALELRTYHVALVDIMLGGELDIGNRDGVKVLEHIRNLGEGTETIVVSAQEESRQLVRNLLKDYGAFDYLDKKFGIPALLEMVTRALQSGANRSWSSWERIVRELASGQSEEAFVGDLLHHLDFSGGFENLSKSLQRACVHLMPLVRKKGDERGMRYDADMRGFRGRYWSKGQGKAVELFMLGRQGRGAKPESPTGVAESSILYHAEKGGLSVLVVEQSGSERSEFAEVAK